MSARVGRLSDAIAPCVHMSFVCTSLYNVDNPRTRSLVRDFRQTLRCSRSAFTTFSVYYSIGPVILIYSFTFVIPLLLQTLKSRIWSMRTLPVHLKFEVFYNTMILNLLRKCVCYFTVFTSEYRSSPCPYHYVPASITRRGFLSI